MHAFSNSLLPNRMPLLPTAFAALLAAAPAPFSLSPQAPAALIESTCTTASGRTLQLRFESASGDDAASDMRGFVQFDADRRVALPLPPGSWEARTPMPNVTNACAGLTATPVGENRLLVLLSRSHWPEPSRADAVLLDAAQGRVLDVQAGIAAIRLDTRGVFSTRAAPVDTLDVRLVFDTLAQAGGDAPFLKIDEWLRLDTDGDRLRRRWLPPGDDEPWTTASAPAPTAAPPPLPHAEALRCRPRAASAFTLSFESPTGEFDMDDEQPVLVFDDGARLALPVEPALFEGRRPLRNLPSICAGISAFELRDARVLFLLSANARPGYSRAVAVLVDLRQRRVLGATAPIASIKTYSDRYFATRPAGASAIEVRLVREDIADSGSDGPDTFAEAWMRFELAGDGLRYRWVAP